jgi:2'-5' RNA ligase
MTMTTDDFRLTVGVTSAVPSPWCETLAKIRIDTGDPFGGVIQPHLTLVPPIEISADELGVFETHLVKVAEFFNAFKVRLRGAGTFRPTSRVVYAAVVAGASECAYLAQLLRSGPVKVPLDFPFHPHVTAAHNVPDTELDWAAYALADFEAEFEVSELLLSTHGTPGVPAGTSGPWTPRRRVRLTQTHL